MRKFAARSENNARRTCYKKDKEVLAKFHAKVFAYKQRSSRQLVEPLLVAFGFLFPPKVLINIFSSLLTTFQAFRFVGLCSITYYFVYTNVLVLKCYKKSCILRNETFGCL